MWRYKLLLLFDICSAALLTLAVVAQLECTDSIVGMAENLQIARCAVKLLTFYRMTTWWQ